jgi:uncharacterized protein
MALFKKPFARAKEDVQTVESDQYIDLGQLNFDEESPLGGQGMVKVAEIYRYEDISTIAKPVYNGNILLVDYSAVQNDSLTLKRITSELKAVARDTNGDVAAIGKNLIVVTPNGIKVDRHKIKGGF